MLFRYAIIIHGTLLGYTSSVQSLDSHLVPRTYLVNNYLTAADVAVYGALRPIFVRRLPLIGCRCGTLL